MNENPFISEAPPEGDSYSDAGMSREAAWYPGKYTRRLIYAGIGALATAVDTAGETFDRLADRGEQATRDLEGKVDDVRRENVGAGSRLRESGRTAVNVFLDTIGVPNKGDVDTINIKLNLVSRKLDEIQMHNVAPATSVPEPHVTVTDPPTGAL